jgi:hypothetical protein
VLGIWSEPLVNAAYYVVANLSQPENYIQVVSALPHVNIP